MSGRILLVARRIVIALLCICYFLPINTSALETIPGTDALVDGPLSITKYSFQGDQVRFVEIYNDENYVVNLSGWSVAVQPTEGDDFERLVDMSGLLAPGSWITVGNQDVFGSNLPTFSFKHTSGISDDRLASVALLPPAGEYLNHVIRPANTSTSLDTLPPTYGFQRNISTSTGNYTSSFSAVLPDDNFRPFDDGLYVPPGHTQLMVVEIFPNAIICSPLETLETNPLCFDYIKLYNPTGSEIDLDDYRIRSGNNVASMDLVLPAGEYAVLPLNMNNSGWVWLEDKYGVESYQNTEVQYPDSGSRRGQAWSWDGEAWRWTKYPTPYNSENQFTDGNPINYCDGLRLSEIGANLDKQYVEVYNSSHLPLDLAGCQLQTNRSQTASYVFGQHQLQPDSYLTVYIDDTDLTLTKTTSGTVYLLSSDGELEVDARSYDNLSRDTSLALVDGVWRQTFTLTPGEVNQYSEYPPCEEGYVRNADTGRCNKVVAPTLLADCGPGRERNPETNRCRMTGASSQLTPCRPGQERNPETNRCRSIALSSTSLTPCRPGQERNPATNRCRSIESGASTLKPCGPGQERNPATNRCRKVNVASVSDAGDFPVEPIADTGRGFAAWWALGGVLILGAGYGAWEWRHEISRSWNRVMSWSRLSK